MRTIFAVAVLTLLNVALPMVAVGQGHATAEEVVAKVREAAATLSKTGDVTPDKATIAELSKLSSKK